MELNKFKELIKALDLNDYVEILEPREDKAVMVGLDVVEAGWLKSSAGEADVAALKVAVVKPIEREDEPTKLVLSLAYRKSRETESYVAWKTVSVALDVASMLKDLWGDNERPEEWEDFDSMNWVLGDELHDASLLYHALSTGGLSALIEVASNHHRMKHLVRPSDNNR